jgi:pyruvate dehydrogenase E2 component (dihydrolipoamide acetyltransferase)
MATLFAMPKLGMNMVEGTIVSWLVREGQRVDAGRPIVAVETDKATQEVEAPAGGVIARILKAEGEVVPCNGVMAVIVAPGEQVPTDIPAMIAEGVTSGPEPDRSGSRESGVRSRETGVRSETGRISISPAARTLAQELGVDITKIVPRSTRIHREDVEAAYQAMQTRLALRAKEPVRKPLTTIRRKIAEHMSQSARSVARVGLSLEADATALTSWRRRLEDDGARTSYNVLLAKLVSVALREFPSMNARLEGDAILEMPDVNIGIAVDTERGLLVPVLRQVDVKEVSVLQQEYAALTGRALSGKSTLQDLEGGTFTITNLGSLEIETFLPVINYPECAVLGVGAIVKRAVVIGDGIAIRPMLTLTLAFDHRLVDGAPAARFLQRVKHLVEEGERA